jgi:hypothetical protein
MLQAGLARTSLLSIAPHSTSFPLGADTVGLGEFTIEGQTFGVADYVPAATQIADPL